MPLKIIKLSKKDHTDLANLLKKAGLVAGNNARPDLLFVNKKTSDKMKREYGKALKKQNPFINKKTLSYSVEMEFLNLGPAVVSNKNGGNRIPDGHAIVLDFDKEEIK